jgi:hypothetical protein
MAQKKFPFRTGILYKVKRDFQFQSSDLFIKDEILFYVRSDYNHYDGIEICFFRDRLSSKLLKWSLHDHELDSWEDYMDVIT